MAQLVIHPIGARFKLVSDWTFMLYLDGRNATLARVLKQKFNPALPESKMGFKPVTLRAGTIITIERYDLRTGSGAFDGMHLNTVVNERFARFWAELDDVNQIDAEVLEPTTERPPRRSQALLAKFEERHAA